jgi:hypothetical protein
MTIFIPVWIITLLQALGVTIVILLAIVGLYVITGLLGAKWWI